MPKKKDIFELTLMSEEQYRHAPKAPLTLLCDNVRSLHNVGSLFRTADALGVKGMILCGISGTPPHPELSKTALGAERTVEWEYRPDAVEAVEQLRAAGVKILVLEQTHDSMPLERFTPQPGMEYCLVAGNEVEGVDQRIVDMADTVLEITQRGTKHSLNVSTSAAIALWHITLQI